LSQARQKKPKRTTDAKAGRKGRGARPSAIRRAEKAQRQWEST
jgi:hypothetical protein